MAMRRWTCTTNIQVIDVPTATLEKDFCACKYVCDYTELASTFLDDTSDEYKNDYRKFLVDLKSNSSTYSVKLVKGGNEIDFDASKHGVLYDQGFNPSQPFLAGIKIDWWKVAFNEGYGDYKVKITTTNFSQDVITESHTFKVIPYNEERLDGTVKIEVLNKGFTHNGTDYTGIEWDNMVRVYGRMNVEAPERESESLESASRELIEVQSKLFRTFTLKVDNIPYEIGNGLLHESQLFNWKLTDYQLLNFGDLRDFNCIVTDSSLEDVPFYDKRNIEFQLRENKNILNRKFTQQ